MKKKGKDPFLNRAIDLFIYNLGEINSSSSSCTRKEILRKSGLEPYNGDLIESLPVTNFGKIFRAHFGEIEKNVAYDNATHNNVFRDNYKIYYYYNNEVETNSIFPMIAGKQAILELLELGRTHNWAVMAIGVNGDLGDLGELPSYGYQSLDAFFADE